MDSATLIWLSVKMQNNITGKAGLKEGKEFWARARWTPIEERSVQENHSISVNDFVRGYKQNVSTCLHAPFIENRDFHVDAMKGVAIFLIVLGHTIGATVSSPQHNYWYQVIFSFAMPLWFFLGGYVAFSSAKKHSGQALISRRFISLLIPYLAWYFILDGLVLGRLWSKGLKVFLLNFIYLPGVGLWFLWVLFLCYLLLVAALALEKKIGVIAFIVILAAVVGLPAILERSLHWAYSSVAGISFLCSYFPLFLIGFFVARYEQRIFKSIYSKTIVSLSLICFPLLLVFSLIGHKGIDPIFVPYYQLVSLRPTLPRLAGTFVALLPIATIFVALRIKKSRKGIGSLSWIGYYSMDIYVMHVAGSLFFVRILGQTIKPTGTIETTLVVLASTFSAILIALIVSFGVLRQNRLLKLLFLGKYGSPDKPVAILGEETGDKVQAKKGLDDILRTPLPNLRHLFSPSK